MQIEDSASNVQETRAPENKKPIHFSKGDYLDAKDSSGNWCVAFVIEILPNDKVLIGFDGWMEKWNEVKTFMLITILYLLGLSNLFKETPTF